MTAANDGSTSKASKSKPGADQRLKRRQVQRAALLMKQVGDATRLQVILLLAEGEKRIGALCEALSQARPVVSHHLVLLRHGGIIVPRRRGKEHVYGLTEVGVELATVVNDLVG
jgi:DNA-binding transcriptional ArsR family regulator